MWFKNLTIFILTEPFLLNPAELHVMLEQAAIINWINNNVQNNASRHNRNH